MSAIFKSSIFLALVVAIGIYLYGSLSREDATLLSPKPEPPLLPSPRRPNRMSVRRWTIWLPATLGRSGGGRRSSPLTGAVSMLNPRGGELERLVHAETTPAPAAAEVSNDASPDAQATSAVARLAAPSPATEVAPLTPDEICKRDGDRLERLRNSPSSEEAARFADELGCEKLRPQLMGVMESLGSLAPAPAAAEVSNGASPDAQATSAVARLAALSPATEVAALPPDEICKRDGDRLERLRNSPSSEEAARFADELGCEKLRPQLLGLMERLGSLAPAPAVAEVSHGAAPDPKAASEAVGPAPPSPGTKFTSDQACKRDGDRLARLRSSPSGEEAQRFASELSCEKLRPQLLPLLESLGQAVPAPAAAEAPNGASPDAKAARDAARPAPPSPGPDVANASSVVAASAAAPLPAQTSAPDNAVRGVSDKESPDAKAVSDAARPAPPSPGPDVANASSVVAASHGRRPLRQRERNSSREEPDAGKLAPLPRSRRRRALRRRTPLAASPTRRSCSGWRRRSVALPGSSAAK